MARSRLAFSATSGYNRDTANRSGGLSPLPKRGTQPKAVKPMSEEFGGDFITLTDEEGNEFELEYCTTVDGEDLLVTLEDEEELDAVYQQVMEDLFAEDEDGE